MRTRLIALALLVSAVVLTTATAKDRFTYIYRRGDSSITRISGSVDQIGKMVKKSYGNEFVWLRMNGRAYVIRDAATLAEVRNAFRHLEEMEPSMREVERRLEPFERELEKIEDRVDELGDSLDDDRLSDSARDAIEDKLRDAEEQMRAVEAKIRPVEQELERLEKESDRREEIAEKQFEGIVERAVRQGVAERVD